MNWTNVKAQALNSAAILLAAGLLLVGASDLAHSQTSNAICVQGALGCTPVSPTNPFPVTDGATGVVNQGAPGVVSAGWPVINGEPVDTTGTFTNGTQSGNVTTPSVDGYATAIISIHGTYNTATATFQASDDGGVTFYPLACNRIDNSNAPELGYTGLTNTNRAWLCNTTGFDEVQVLSSAVTSGTVSVRISQSSASIQAPAQQSIVAGQRTIIPLDISTVTTGGTAVTALNAGHATAGGFIITANVAGVCVDQQTTAGTVTGTPSSTVCEPVNTPFYLIPNGRAVSINSTASAVAVGGEGLN